MARDSSGTHSLPAGQPVVTGTTITSSAFNVLTDDISDEITDSLSRSGKGGMTAALRLADGTAGTPAVAFTNDTAVGIYRSASGEASIVAGSTAVAKWTSASFFASLVQAVTAVTIRILGRMADAANAVGVALDTSATYSTTGAKIVSFRNNTSEKAYVHHDGAYYAAATETGTVTAGSNWTDSSTCKRAAGLVSVTINAFATNGSAAWNSVATLPAGFRPATTVAVMGRISDNSTGFVYPAWITISAAGVVNVTEYLNTTMVALFAIGANDTVLVNATFPAV